MRQLSPAGQDLIAGVAQRHGFSVDATLSMLDAVIAGNGSMAQFNHPEFSGSGQWMSGGMTMLSDMFNNYLKGRVDGLCSELSAIVANQPDLVRGGSFQSQSQGDAQASLFVDPAPVSSANWWPADLQWPNSTGAQNNVRYAYFAQARRLVIDVAGTVTVYDTLDHQIGGFSQQQGGGGTLGFSSQYGLIDVTSLPVISSNGVPPAATRLAATPFPAQATSQPADPAPAPFQPAAAPAWPTAGQAPAYVVDPVPLPIPAPLVAPADNGSFSNAQGGAGSSTSTSSDITSNSADILATIERLADLHAKGILSPAEFGAKKAELLGRL
ncbi:MAG: hypothetical protein RIQ60_285 [Pseudomonadota bacterium]|jgi:hypothetical protein